MSDFDDLISKGRSAFGSPGGAGAGGFGGGFGDDGIDTSNPFADLHSSTLAFGGEASTTVFPSSAFSSRPEALAPRSPTARVPSFGEDHDEPSFGSVYDVGGVAATSSSASPPAPAPVPEPESYSFDPDAGVADYVPAPASPSNAFLIPGPSREDDPENHPVYREDEGGFGAPMRLPSPPPGVGVDFSGRQRRDGSVDSERGFGESPPGSATRTTARRMTNEETRHPEGFYTHREEPGAPAPPSSIRSGSLASSQQRRASAASSQQAPRAPQPEPVFQPFGVTATLSSRRRGSNSSLSDDDPLSPSGSDALSPAGGSGRKALPDVLGGGIDPMMADSFMRGTKSLPAFKASPKKARKSTPNAAESPKVAGKEEVKDAKKAEGATHSRSGSSTGPKPYRPYGLKRAEPKPIVPKEPAQPPPPPTAVSTVEAKPAPAPAPVTAPVATPATTTEAAAKPIEAPATTTEAPPPGPVAASAPASTPAEPQPTAAPVESAPTTAPSTASTSTSPSPRPPAALPSRPSTTSIVTTSSTTAVMAPHSPRSVSSLSVAGVQMSKADEAIAAVAQSTEGEDDTAKVAPAMSASEETEVPKAAEEVASASPEPEPAQTEVPAPAEVPKKDESDEDERPLSSVRDDLIAAASAANSATNSTTTSPVVGPPSTGAGGGMVSVAVPGAKTAVGEAPKMKPRYVCIVGDPQKTGSINDLHTVYTVRTKATDPTAGGPLKSSSTVLRRFRDFVWLSEALVANNPGVIVPPIPDKNLRSRFQPNFITARKVALEIFLAKTTGHPMLVSDPDLKMFLESDSFSLEIKHRKPDPSQPQGWLSNLGGPRFIEFDDFYDNRRASVDALEHQLRALHASLHTAAKSRLSLAHSLNELSGCLVSLAECDLSRPMRSAVEKLAALHKQLNQWTEDEAREEEEGLGATVDAYARLCASVRATFGGRIRSWEKWKAAEQHLRKTQTGWEKTKRSSMGPGAGGVTLAELSDAERRAHDAQNEFEDVSKLIKVEMQRFDKEKVDDFKEGVGRYVDGMLKRQRMIVKAWQDYYLLLQQIARQNAAPPAGASAASNVEEAPADAAETGEPHVNGSAGVPVEAVEGA